MVKEVSRVLTHDLGKLDGVGRWAAAAAGGTGTLAIRNVALVVGRVEVDTVPAPSGLLDQNIRVFTMKVSLT